MARELHTNELSLVGGLGLYLRKTINLLALSVLWLGLSPFVHAASTVYLYTEKANFLTAAGLYGLINLETFSSLNGGTRGLLPHSISLPQEHGSNLIATSAVGGLFSETSKVQAPNEWLETDPTTTTMTLTFESAQHAVGGDFFLSNFSGGPLSATPFTVTATLSDNSQLVVHFTDVNRTANPFTGFAGFVSDDLTIDSVSISLTNGGAYASVDNFYTTTIPEPTTLLLLGSGLLFWARLARKRRTSQA